jgi:type I restriction enzyme S subunit
MAAYTAFPTTCNQSMAAVVFEEYDPKFMFWWLTSQYKNIRGLASDDARDGLNLEMIGSIPCPIFDKKEQQQIAQFLDDKTAHLDKLIGQKQQMIGLLHEKRMALITQAVTKGLDLTVPMKYSGVEWLGDVPELWEIRKLKFSADLISDKVNAKDSELPFIGLENIESFTGKIITANNEQESDGVALGYQADDVLFCKLRPYLAKVYLASYSGLCTSELLVLRGIESTPSFLKYYLLSPEFINIVNSSTYGSKMPRANWEFIGNLACLIPSWDEQQQITQYLDTETQKIDYMIKAVKQAIATLQEYRTALITTAVTGKIDVRGFKLYEG